VTSQVRLDRGRERLDRDDELRHLVAQAIEPNLLVVEAGPQRVDPSAELSTLGLDPPPELSTLSLDPSAELGSLGHDPPPELSTLGLDPPPELSTLGLDPSAELGALGLDPSAELGALSVDLAAQEEEATERGEQSRPEDPHDRPGHRLHRLQP
jgi:hypothetical protein